MSDNWIVLVPVDPHFVPDQAKQSVALSRLADIAPNADGVEIKVMDEIQFFDCGANFERIICPSCHSEIDMDWWQQCMDDDVEEGFKLASYPVPCCGANCALHELGYDWPQAFGRFAIEVMNPNIEKLNDKHRKALEDSLGVKLVVVYQHL